MGALYYHPNFTKPDHLQFFALQKQAMIACFNFVPLGDYGWKKYHQRDRRFHRYIDNDVAKLMTVLTVMTGNKQKQRNHYPLFSFPKPQNAL
jgi:hypothetical protein